MARTIKVVFGMATLFLLWAALKLQVAPWWRDFPREDKFSFSLLFEDTEYSSSYAESKFSLVRPGMKREAVLKLLGDPIRITTSSRGKVVTFSDYQDGNWVTRSIDLPPGNEALIDSETLFYSRQGSPTADWYIRAITFSKEGMVTEITKSLYID